MRITSISATSTPSVFSHADKVTGVLAGRHELDALTPALERLGIDTLELLEGDAGAGYLDQREHSFRALLDFYLGDLETDTRHRYAQRSNKADSSSRSRSPRETGTTWWRRRWHTARATSCTSGCGWARVTDCRRWPGSERRRQPGNVSSLLDDVAVRTDRPRNRPPTTAALGGVAAALAVAALVIALPSQAPTSVGDTPAESQCPSVSGGQTSPPQHALHSATTTTAGVALRLANPGGCPPASVQEATAPRPGGQPDTPAVTRVVTSRTPLRVLLCTWLI